MKKKSILLIIGFSFVLCSIAIFGPNIYYNRKYQAISQEYMALLPQEYRGWKGLGSEPFEANQEEHPEQISLFINAYEYLQSNDIENLYVVNDELLTKTLYFETAHLNGSLALIHYRDRKEATNRFDILAIIIFLIITVSCLVSYYSRRKKN